MAVTQLRPYADISNNFSLSSGSKAYLMVNEESQDGDSTRLYFSTSNTSSETKTVNLSIDKSIIKSDFIINKITAVVVIKHNGTLDSATVSVGNQSGSITGVGSSYKAISVQIPTTADFSSMSVSVSFCSNSSKSTKTVAITQMYIEVDYTDPSAKKLTVTYNGRNIISEERAGELLVTYGSKTLINIPSGVKTLNCANKLASDDIYIFEHKINCKDKVFATDIVIKFE